MPLNWNDINKFAVQYGRFLEFIGKALLRPGREIERVADECQQAEAVIFYALSLLTSLIATIFVVGFGLNQPIFMASYILVPSIGFLLFLLSAHLSFKVLRINVEWGWWLKTSLLEASLVTFVSTAIYIVRIGVIKYNNSTLFNEIIKFETNCSAGRDISDYAKLLINPDIAVPTIGSLMILIIYIYYVELCMLYVFLVRSASASWNLSDWKFGLLGFVGSFFAVVAAVIFFYVAIAIGNPLCAP